MESQGFSAFFMSQLFDQYLLFRIRTKRDADAYARLYDRYVVAIYRFVFLKLPTKEIAEDVTSETFLKCWQYVQANHEVRNIRALLYRIARNLVADNYRKIDKTVSLNAAVTNDPAVTSSLLQGDPSDLDRGRAMVEAKADVSLLLTHLSRLKEDYHDVLALRLIDGLGFGDIAQILEKTPGHVRVIYHRALKALDPFVGGKDEEKF